MVSSVVGAVAGGLVNKALGGGSSSSRPTSTPTTVAGSEFQPFTYTGSGGFGVTGTQTGDYGYDWQADIPQWIQDLGQVGAGATGGLFQDYLTAVGKDPYEAANEYYQRGLAQLQPELAKQQIESQARMFGTGRLGLKLAGEGLGAGAGSGMINPDAFGLAAGQAKSLQDLYTQSLSQGQAMQTNELNKLRDAADAMMALGMQPAEVEQSLIKFASGLESARSNALKAGTQMVEYGETPQSVFAGEVSNAVGSGVANYLNQGSMGLPTSFSGGSPWMSSSNQDWASSMGYGNNSGGSLFSGIGNTISGWFS
jgi:hypothetical protein